MATGRLFLRSTISSLLFALLFLLMCLSRQTLFSRRCLDPGHPQQIVSQGDDCVYDVNISSSLKRSSKWISHVSRSRARVSYYCNSVATFYPIIKVIYDIELNPGPAQVCVKQQQQQQEAFLQ